MTNEEWIEVYNHGFKEGAKHAVPSKDTENFINITEKRLELIDFRMEGIDNNIKEIRNSLRRSDEKFDALIDKLDQRYARKETETSVNRIAWLVISAVVVALLGLILKQ